MSRLPAILLLNFVLASAGLQARIISATLEYTADVKVSIFINGNPVLANAFAPDHYRVISSSDGTLPLDVFQWGGENVLAVENSNHGAVKLGCGYLLTIKFSDRQPMQVFGHSDNTRILGLNPGQPAPAGWAEEKFQDAAWKAPLGHVSSNMDGFVQLPTLKAVMGDRIYSVPILCAVQGCSALANSKSYLRTKFSLADTLEKPRLNSKAAGARLGMTLDAGTDGELIGVGKLKLRLPQGYQAQSASPGGAWVAAENSMSWGPAAFSTPRKHIKLLLASVAAAPKWDRPESVLKSQVKHWSEADLNKQPAAIFQPEAPGWFRADVANRELMVRHPRVEGVLFRAEMRFDTNASREEQLANDSLTINYSVDGSQNPALAKDAKALTASQNSGWMEAYYDASADRKWNWRELAQLQLKLATTRSRWNRRCKLVGFEVWVRAAAPQPAALWAWAAPAKGAALGSPGLDWVLDQGLVMAAPGGR